MKCDAKIKSIVLLILGAASWAQDRPPAGQSPSTSELIVPAGTWIKIRVDDVISSNRNRPGDYFTGTMAQPLIVDGYVVARRGQTIEGQVVEALPAGRTKGTSRLAIQVTEIAVADGRQIPVATQIIGYTGSTSKGADAAAIGATAGLGAAIGGVVDGGAAAGIGAAAGAAAATIGVLATRGRATEIYPENVITFRTTAPIVVDTSRALHAFVPANQGDYENRAAKPRPPAQPQPPVWGPAWGVWGVPPVWGGPGWWTGYPGWYGTNVVIYGGGRRYGRWR